MTMKRVAQLAIAVLVLSGCSYLATNAHAAITGAPDQSFNYNAPKKKAILVLIGGNSECRGDRGIWKNRDKLAHDVMSATGLGADELSRRYFSWTGEEPTTGRWRCLPRAAYLLGQYDIVADLDGELAPDTALIVIAHSNGGATAAQVADLFHRQGHPVDLLVTLDPVSIVTRLPRRPPPRAHANLWIDAYVSSDEPLFHGDVVPFIGGAWNRFAGPTVIKCMEGHHGDVVRMWESVALASDEFKDWGKGVHDRLHLASDMHPPPGAPFIKCEREPHGYG